VAEQCRAIELLEVCQLFTSGLPHRLRPETFLTRYGMLFARVHKSKDGNSFKDERPTGDGTSQKLQPSANTNLGFGTALDQEISSRKSTAELVNNESRRLDCMVAVSMFRQEWAGLRGVYREAVLGSRHLFLSEGARQHLEKRRRLARTSAARVLQKWWKMLVKENGEGRLKVVLQTLKLHKLDAHQPPPLPPRRSYTVVKDSKVSFPQRRILHFPYRDDSGVSLDSGEEVLAVGVSSRPAHLIVQTKEGQHLQLPFHYLSPGTGVTSLL